MFKRKYAIRFPDFQVPRSIKPDSIYSMPSIQETVQTIKGSFNLLHSLTNYVIEKNRTLKLKKQLEAKREALDTQIEQKIQQERLTLEAYSEQLQIRLRSEKQQMEIEINRFKIETSQKCSELSLTVEEAIRESHIWMQIIQHQYDFFISIEPYIKQLESDYAHRKEYILYCDMQRKALNRIEDYLKKIV